MVIQWMFGGFKMREGKRGGVMGGERENRN
jgi:hypothetical protein